MMKKIIAVCAIVSLSSFALASPPPAPTVTSPSSGGLVNNNKPDITWTGGFHDAYEVHIGLYNTPSSAEGWNSGTVNVGSPVTSVRSGPLTVQQTFYVYVRHHNPDGWGPWSQPNVHFYVAGEWLNDPTWINPGGMWPQDTAFNPARNEYLTVYRISDGDVPRVTYCRLNSSGNVLGSAITLVDPALSGVHKGVVAYNSVNAEYLIAYGGWLDTGGGSTQDGVRAQRVNATTGLPIGAPTALFGPAPGGVFEPAIAYSPTSNLYLVAWHEDGPPNAQIFGVRVAGATGTLIGTNFSLSPSWTQYCAVPHIAYNSSANEFEVMYQVSRDDIGHGFDEYGQRLRASDGVLLGDAHPIGTAGPAWDRHGDIVYDSDMNRYLAVYECLGDASGSLYGQFLTATGGSIGGRFSLLPLPDAGGMISVDWMPSTKEFMVAWMDGDSYSNYAQRISQTGALIGEKFDITNGLAGIGNFEPQVVANTVSNEFLFAWYNSYTNVYDRRVKLYPLPSADVTAPASVTGLTLQRFPSSIILNWTNPATSDFMGTSIRYKTTGYPTGPTDGLLIADLPNAPSTSDTFTHTGLIKGVTYYYAVFAHDEALNYASATLGSAKIFPADFDGDDDVDMKDFAHFQNCLSGDGIPYGPGCVDADLNEDSSVGQSDFAIFLPCLAGSNMPPGC
jgi:hypothetical protein